MAGKEVLRIDFFTKPDANRAPSSVKLFSRAQLLPNTHGLALGLPLIRLSCPLAPSSKGNDQSLLSTASLQSEPCTFGQRPHEHWPATLSGFEVENECQSFKNMGAINMNAAQVHLWVTCSCEVQQIKRGKLFPFSCIVPFASLSESGEGSLFFAKEAWILYKPVRNGTVEYLQVFGLQYSNR